MKILILGLNYAPEKVGVAVYTSGMAEALARSGHEVEVVVGQPYYPAWKVAEGYSRWLYKRSTENGVKILRCPLYVPARPSALRRVLHHMSFGLAALFPMLTRAIASRPDIVFTVAPALISAPVAAIAARLSGAKSWLHIQDFELEAAFATGLMSEQGLLPRLASWFERTTLSRFDVVSSISDPMCRKLAAKGVAAERIVQFRNWSDIDAVRPLETLSPYAEEWGVHSPHVLLYSGNIANKQGIEVLVDAARLLADRKDLTFVVCGDGPNRERLERLADGLPNLRFFPLQPKERLGELLGLASIHVLPQIAGAADLVLPSKLTNMLSSGRPIIATADPGTALAIEVEGCGVVTPPGDAEALAKAITNLMEDAALHHQCGQNARRRAEERWAKPSILRGFEAKLSALAGRHSHTVSGAGDVLP
ncbi:colanic acid biosynthesis glycosyltransferase WcaI [Kaistia algarum]|uniref:WcaI family glycosyltransferase n=1 Tax=Kaistia algarum TaxID=2083279 RepID=UPI000CE7427B|nr:WcaI family glycosyltransferase [Kaistia algarum]MCX5516783.1 WcaI family glycosyltransferase [Kaistia algarum]PPE77205.1 colanic acid biosynthesis glycosyltransferase WcaI [Kaistia algarum]